MRIPEILLDGVAFLYRSKQEAAARVKIGGTGFIVGRKLAGSEEVFGHRKYLPYLVSNRHVVFEGSACVASVNRRSGGVADPWDIDQNDWVSHPTADLAATCVVNYLRPQEHRVTHVPDTRLLVQDFIERSMLGIGDEVFMVGRFVNHQGSRENRPAVRFGSLSMMLETVRIKNVEHPQECFSAEMRSRTGFSGSPVTAYRTRATTLMDVPVGYVDFWRLLGVNAGYVIDEDDESNTWLNAVIPAWKIMELLNMPKLRSIQGDHEKDIAEQGAMSSIAGTVQIKAATDAELEPSTTEDNP